MAYDPAVTAQLEAAFAAGAPSIPSITIRSQAYSIGFDRLAGSHVQANAVYGTQRPVQRSAPGPGGQAAATAAAVPAAPLTVDWQVAADQGVITYSAANAAVIEDCVSPRMHIPRTHHTLPPLPPVQVGGWCPVQLPGAARSISRHPPAPPTTPLLACVWDPFCGTLGVLDRQGQIAVPPAFLLLPSTAQGPPVRVL